MQVLVVTGVAREAGIARGSGIRTICSGGSPGRLRRILADEDFSDIVAVTSFGIGGGLNPALAPGHIVIADAIVSVGGRRAADNFITEALMKALNAVEGAHVLRASIAGVDEALVSADAKTECRTRTGAALVDMESHIAAEYAVERGVPFAAVRAVCDPADRGLPPLVNHALDSDGGISIPGVLGSLVRHPGQIGDLIRLGRDSRMAFRALEDVAQAFRRAVGV